jgi:hypothetical protein
VCLNEAYIKIHKGNYFSDSFPIQNAIKQGDALLPLLFNFASEYDIRKIHGKPGGTEIKWNSLATALC